MRLTDFYERGRLLSDWVTARTLARLPLSPTFLTVTGALLHIAVALLLAWGYLPWAAGLLLIAGGFDVADGAVARVTGKKSNLGAFLDATLDRYAEAITGLGLFFYLLQKGIWLDLLLLYILTSGSLIFSYTWARAQAEGFSAHPGLLTRALRVCLLALGLLAGQVRIALWVLAAGVVGSALHRLLGVCAEAYRKTPAADQKPLPRWLKGLLPRRPLGG